MRSTLTGWGRTAPSVADVVPGTTDEEIAGRVAAAGPRGVLARGLGRSYGDAAQNAGGLVIDMTARGRRLDFDNQTGVLEVEAGASLDQLMRELLPRGWFPPVTPGTRQVTVGGAIAADVHGKNHHRAGSFGNHLESITLLCGDGEVRELGPGDALFWATVGGMGLTGIVLRARFRMKAVESSTCLVDTVRCDNLDAVMAAMADNDTSEYSVAWVDCLARGAALGRSVLTRGRFATAAELPGRTPAERLGFRPRRRIPTPPVLPNGLLNRWSVRAFNEAWFRKELAHREGEAQSVSTFFHPLDAVDGWNRIYGRSGFLQYQILVPEEEHDTIRRCIEAFSSAGWPSFLSVLKRLGPGNAGYLSFPGPGWALSLDVPAAGSTIGPLLDELDRLVLAAGGRSYFAKDSRMTPATAHAMYPRLAEWNDIRHAVDPKGRFMSDLARRLEL